MKIGKEPPKDPITQFVEGLRKELDDLVRAYMKEYPNTELSKDFPKVTSLMGASSIISIIKEMIKK